jgi:hypothetical protein
MEVCRKCHREIAPGQKAWRLGRDAEHEECFTVDPTRRLPQLRAALRRLDQARASILALGRHIIDKQMHRRANTVPPNNDEAIERIAREIHEAARELRRDT